MYDTSPTTVELDPSAVTQRVELRRTRDFGSVINVVFELFRKNAKPLMRSIVLIVGPSLVISTVVGVMSMSRMIGAMTSTPGDSFDDVLAMYGETWGMMLISIIAGVLTTFVLVIVVSGYIRLYVERAPAEISVGDVWHEVTRSFVRVALTIILTSIVTLLPMAVLVGLAALAESVPVGVLAVFLGAAPTLYLAVAMTIAVQMRMEENIGLFASIGRCIQLMRGRWWFSFWVYVVMTFVVMLASAIFQVPVQIASGISSFSGSEPNLLIIVIGAAVSTVGSYLMYSVLIATCSVQYYNLVEQKEGVGLIDRINAIGAPTELEARPHDAFRS